MATTDPTHLPTELRAQIIESVLTEIPDSTPWRRAHALRNIRLINRAWCTSANDVLFAYLAVYAERNLGYEVQRIRKVKELSETGLGWIVKTFEVVLSPGYCRYRLEPLDSGDVFDGGEQDGDGEEEEDLVDILARDLPGMIPRFVNLTSLAFTLPTREELHWRSTKNPNDVDWDRFPLDRQEKFYRTVHACLSSVPLPHLRSLSIDLFETCDLDILTLAERQAQNSFLAENLSNLTSLSLTVKRGRPGHSCPSASNDLVAPINHGHLFSASDYASFLACEPHVLKWNYPTEIIKELVDFAREISGDRYDPGSDGVNPYSDPASKLLAAFPRLTDLEVGSDSPEATLELREQFAVPPSSSAEEQDQEKHEPLPLLPLRSLTLCNVHITYHDVIALLRRAPHLERLHVHDLENRDTERFRRGVGKRACLGQEKRREAVRDVVAGMERLDWEEGVYLR